MQMSHRAGVITWAESELDRGPGTSTRSQSRRASVVEGSSDMNPQLFTLEDANDMITEIKRLHSEERLMQVTSSLLL